MIPQFIAIDGPAGVGKSTTARAVAKRLGLPYLDTGALYRAASWIAKRRDIDLNNHQVVTRAVENARIVFLEGESATRVWIDGQEITNSLRTPEINQAVSSVCEIPAVRQHLVKLQREWAERGFGIMEGRDIGTVVLPNAGLKLYMTARPEIRAQRRGKEEGISDDPKALAKLAEELRVRDKRDMKRDDSPLRRARNAVLIDNSDITFDEQVTMIIRLASERFGAKLYGASDRT